MPSALTVEGMIALFRRHARLFAIIALSIFAIAAILAFVQTPKYESVTRLLIEPSTKGLVPDTDEEAGLFPKDQGVVDTQVEVLHSTELARRVARELNLRNDPEFGNASNDNAQAADAVSGALSVRRVGETYLIDIAADSVDSTKASKIANAFATNYLALQTEMKRTVNQLATRMLDQRVKSMAEKVKLAELKVQQYKIANGLMSVNGATLAEQSIASIDNDLARARAEELEAFGRLSSAQGSGARLGASSSVALQDLLSKQAIAQQDLGQAQLKYGEKHPAFQAAQDRVDQLNRSIAAERRRAEQSLTAETDRDLDKLRAEAAAAAQKRRSLEESVNATREALTSTNRAQVEFNDLLRDATAIRTTYESYLNRYQETLTKQGAETPDARIVSKAFPTLAPAKPDKKMYLVLGALLGIATAFSVIVLITLLDPRLSTAADVERYFDLDALPSIATLESTLSRDEDSDLSSDPAEHVIAHPYTAFTEQFRTLLAAIRKPDAKGRAKIIALTSSLPNEGKTTTSICLARVAAMSGLRTVIVDCDLRHRSLNRYVPTGNRPGLIEYLRGQASLAHIQQVDEATGAMIVPVSASPSRVSDNLGGERMKELLTALHSSYDIVILDTPPVLPLADTRVIVSLADTVVMMARWRSTSRRAVESALQILASSGADIMGVCLTMTDLRKMSTQGYGDPSFYYSRYKDYFSDQGSFERAPDPVTPELRKTA
jgi:capsular exopolysaccharide synthesis family protein